jgi:hypothetical protein
MQPETTKPAKQRMLEEAIRLVTGPRERAYAPPSRNFDLIARLQAVAEECPDPLARVALMNIAQKMARLIETPDHEDSWTDIAGYAACGYEVTRTQPVAELPTADPLGKMSMAAMERNFQTKSYGAGE